MASKDINKDKCILCYKKHSPAKKGVQKQLYSVSPLFKKSFDIRFPGHFMEYGSVGFCNPCYRDKMVALEDLYAKLIEIENEFNDQAKRTAFSVIESIRESGFSNNNPNGNPFDSIRYLIYERWIRSYNVTNHQKEQAALEAAADLEKKRALTKCNPPNTITITIKGTKFSSPSSSNIPQSNGISSALAQKLTASKLLASSNKISISQKSNINVTNLNNPVQWKTGRPTILKSKSDVGMNESEAPKTSVTTSQDNKEVSPIKPMNIPACTEIVPEVLMKKLSDGAEEDICPTDELEVMETGSDDEEVVDLLSDDEIIPTTSEQSQEITREKEVKKIPPNPVNDFESERSETIEIVESITDTIEKETDIDTPKIDKENAVEPAEKASEAEERVAEEIATDFEDDVVSTEGEITDLEEISSKPSEEMNEGDGLIEKLLPVDQSEALTQIIQIPSQMTEPLDKNEEIITAQTILTELDVEKNPVDSPSTEVKSNKPPGSNSFSFMNFIPARQTRSAKRIQPKMYQKRSDDVEEIITSSSIQTLSEEANLNSHEEVANIDSSSLHTEIDLFSSSSSNADSLPSPFVTADEESSEMRLEISEVLSPKDGSKDEESEKIDEASLRIDSDLIISQDEETLTLSKESTGSLEKILKLTTPLETDNKMRRAVIIKDGRIIKRVVVKMPQQAGCETDKGETTTAVPIPFSPYGPNSIYVHRSSGENSQGIIIFEETDEKVKTGTIPNRGRPKKKSTQLIVEPMAKTSKPSVPPRKKIVIKLQKKPKKDVECEIVPQSYTDLAEPEKSKPEEIKTSESADEPPIIDISAENVENDVAQQIDETNIPQDDKLENKPQSQLSTFPVSFSILNLKKMRKRRATVAVPSSGSETANRSRRTIKKTFDSPNWASGKELDKLLKDVEKDGRKAKKVLVLGKRMKTSSPEDEQSPNFNDFDGGQFENTQRIQIENGITGEILPLEEKEYVEDKTVNEDLEGIINYKCPWCSEKFNNHDDLQQHISQHKNPIKQTNFSNVSQCGICSLYFTSQEDFLLHQQVHEEVFDCDICGIDFFSSMNLEKHRKVHTLKFPCDKCEEKFADESKLEEHGVDVHDLMFKCDDCYMAFRSKDRQKMHREKYHKTELFEFECKRCLQFFPNNSDLKDHQREQLAVHNVQCSMCTESFPWDCALRVHMKVHYPGRFFMRCEECQESFTSSDTWDQHLIVKHDDEMK